VWGWGLEDGTAAGFIREENFRDIEEWIDASDLVDFLADEMDGLLVWRDGDAHAFCWGDFFVARWCVAPILEVSAALLCGAAWSAIAIARGSIASWPVIVTTGWAVFATGRIGLRFRFRLVAGTARPCWAEGEAGQKATQWIV
jgi:hypothetical protein